MPLPVQIIRLIFRHWRAHAWLLAWNWKRIVCDHLESSWRRNLSRKLRWLRKSVVGEQRINRSHILYEVAMSTAFQTGPYRHPIVGWMNDLDNMMVDDLREWYQQVVCPE